MHAMQIVPPKSWRPPCAIDKASFKFPTRIQSVHELQSRPSLQEQDRFYEEFHECLAKQGRALKKAPVFANKDIDLFKMHRAVQRRGGYQTVTDEKQWKDIVRILQVGLRVNTPS